MTKNSDHKSNISNTNYSSIVRLFGILLVLLCLTVGCQSRSVTATINYGPFGPIELPTETVKALMDHIPTLGIVLSEQVNTDVWPLEIEFSPRSKFHKVTIYSNGIAMIDNQPRQFDNALLTQVRKDFLELLADTSFTEALMKCDTVKLRTDEPGLELSLDSEKRETIGSLIKELSMEEPYSGYSGAPYPGYILSMDWRGVSTSAVLVGRESDYIVLSTYGFYRHLSWHDPDGSVWNCCFDLLPPPSYEQRQGITKLFASTNEVRASGGDLGQPIICNPERTPSLIRLLQSGQASSDSVPDGESVIVTFTNDKNEWKVFLYENGYLFENQYYRLNNIKATFLTSMNAG